MNHVSDLFWQASLEDIKRGYIYDDHQEDFICLICGERFTKGLVYSHKEHFYEAEKFAKLHISLKHQSSFHFLLNLDKKYTGLTDHQKSILELFYQGQSDSSIAQELQIGSTSTIRNHRFSLKEKQKQAKVFLALMELLGDKTPKKDSFIEIPLSTKQIDDRFAITEQENEKIITAYFKQGLNGPLSDFPQKEKKRVAILKHLLKRFEPNIQYTEKEVNAILKPIYHDYVLLRRYFIEYGFMDRTRDGSAYWVKL